MTVESPAPPAETVISDSDDDCPSIFSVETVLCNDDNYDDVTVWNTCVSDESGLGSVQGTRRSTGPSIAASVRDTQSYRSLCLEVLEAETAENGLRDDPPSLEGTRSCSPAIYEKVNHDNGSVKVRCIPRDGNCLYRAVLHQIHPRSWPTSSAVDALRSKVAKYIEDNKRIYQDFFTTQKEFNDSIASIRQPGSWGGHESIDAIANVFGRAVIIFTELGPVHTIAPRDCSLAASPVRLAYRYHDYEEGIAHNHYDSVVEEIGDDYETDGSPRPSSPEDEVFFPQRPWEGQPPCEPCPPSALSQESKENSRLSLKRKSDELCAETAISKVSTCPTSGLSATPETRFEGTQFKEVMTNVASLKYEIISITAETFRCTPIPGRYCLTAISRRTIATNVTTSCGKLIGTFQIFEG